MKTIHHLIFLFLSMSGMVNVQAQDNVRKLSLTQACVLAADSNLQVLNASLEVKKTHYQLMEAKSKLLPQISGYSDLSYYYAIPRMMMPGEFFGSTGEIAVQIGTKYDWNSGFKASVSLINLSNNTALRLAKRMEKISELTLDEKKEELVYQVSQVYYLFQSTQLQYSLLQINMKNTKRLLEILESQLQNGTARKIDHSKVLVTKNNLQTQLDNLHKLKVQQGNLIKFLTGIDQKISLELTDSLAINTTSLLAQYPEFSNHTDVKLLEKQKEVAVLNKQSILRSYLPSLSTSGQYYYQGQQNDFNYLRGSDKFFKVGFVALNLSVPIFDGFEKHAKIQQYRIDYMTLENSRKNTIAKITKDYADAIEQYQTGLQTLSRQKENIAIAEEDYNISFQRYQLQIMALSDLMLSENSLTEARLSYVDALLQLKNAELEIKKAKGELLKF